MGFLDKVKQTASDVSQKTQASVDSAQQKKKAENLFRDLGVVTFAEAQGRVSERSQAEVARILGELRQLEADGVELNTTLKTGQQPEQASPAEAGDAPPASPAPAPAAPPPPAPSAEGAPAAAPPPAPAPAAPPPPAPAPEPAGGNFTLDDL